MIGISKATGVGFARTLNRKMEIIALSAVATHSSKLVSVYQSRQNRTGYEYPIEQSTQIISISAGIAGTLRVFM